MRVTIFAGPSIPAREIGAILPEAVIRPPAEQGDLLYARDQDSADLLVLIDGTFHQNLSVWHSEVCYLLSTGVRIFGASSMGALRAAETEQFGTIGVGTIFGWYRDGVISGDDEVALLHGDEEAGYRPMSLPLVNIRASLTAAVSAGRLDPAAARTAVDIVRPIYYPHRQINQISTACREAGFDDSTVDQVVEALTSGYVDAKKADALAVLQQVRDMLDGRSELPEPIPFTFARSSVFDTLYNLDRKVPAGDDAVRLQEIAEYAALHCAEFTVHRTNALNRELAVFLGMLLGLKVTKAELADEIALFRAARHITTEEELADWLRTNSLSQADLHEHLAQESICRRLREWMVHARGFDRGARPTLDELRMRGLYEELASAASRQEIIATNYAKQPEYLDIPAIHPAVLAHRHAVRTGVSIEGDARQWAHDTGFESVEDLADALRRAAIAHDVQDRILAHLSTINETAPTQASASELVGFGLNGDAFDDAPG